MKQSTVLRIAELADDCFSWGTMHGGASVHVVNVDAFADLLFEWEIGDKAVQLARLQPRQMAVVKNFVLQLWAQHDAYWPEHAGPTFEGHRTERMLRVAEAVLEYSNDRKNRTMYSISLEGRSRLVAALQLDGYQLRSGRLLKSEENVFDVPEQEGVLVELFRSLKLPKLAMVQFSLKNSDDHYLNGKWGDCIKHARDVLEVTLLEVARAFVLSKGGALDAKAEKQPFMVREALKETGLISEPEKVFIAALYGLLSAQGGHPNMSAQESARICRQYLLSAAHFVLLRCGAMLAKS